MRSSTPPVRLIVSRPECDAECARPRSDCAFRVDWSINPHMLPGSADPRRAARQHAAFVDALVSAGAIVEHVPFVHGAFDSVFTKDNALVVERDDGIAALLARPRHEERAREQGPREAALRAMNADVVRSDEVFEGGDVVLLPSGRAFLGFGFRSSLSAAATIEAFLGRRVVGLELCDPHLYHLDMALTVLTDGTALVCEEALTPTSLHVLERERSIRDIIRVPLEEALRFGVNLTQVGRTIVWGADAPRTSEALRARGFDVRRVDLEEFHRAGGSAACLVARVHCPVVMRSPSLVWTSFPPRASALSRLSAPRVSLC